MSVSCEPGFTPTEKGYASLTAMVCSLIFLNFALGFFQSTRTSLCQLREEQKSLKRIHFRTNGLPEFWEMGGGLLQAGLSEGEFTWENEPVFIDIERVVGDYFSVETIRASALEHPEWGIVIGRRIGTESRQYFLAGLN